LRRRHFDKLMKEPVGRPLEARCQVHGLVATQLTQSMHRRKYQGGVMSRQSTGPGNI
jgi:hypothetical protein